MPKYQAKRKAGYREHNAKRDPQVTAWMHSKRYLDLRQIHLSEHPLCVEHLKYGRDAAGTVIDHITPHKGNYDLFWDTSNWQTLCNPCHSAKTAREDHGFGNK